MKNKNSQGAQECPSRCPDNSAFKQQKLPAWKPKLTAPTVLSSFFTIGLFCLLMGICLILYARSVKEIQINYSDICLNCSKLRENSSNWDKDCDCAVHFTLQENMLGDVFMYYRLQNFYQNHRRYVLSRSDAQLLGQDVNIQNSNCEPFTTYPNGTPMAPCGAIANSMFNEPASEMQVETSNPSKFHFVRLTTGVTAGSCRLLITCITLDLPADSIQLFYYLNSSTAIEVPLLKSGNSWWSDKNVKFRNPTSYNLSSAFAGTTRPPYWQKPAYLLDEEDERNNGYINDDFIIWMRASAFPTFRNLYRRLSHTNQFADGLPAGNYTFHITYNFPVTKFKGKKQVVLSTITWSGGSNLFLGIAYTVSGVVIVLAGFIITAIHLKLRKKKTYFQR